MNNRSVRANAVKDLSSPQRILKVAEELFALHGLNGVSMRQISEAAECTNPFSVQYHFGDKTKLVQAIIDNHQPRLERRRGALLDHAIATGHENDVRTLLEASLLPITEVTNENGEHVYVRLLWQVMRPELAVELPITPPRLPRSGEIWARIRARLCALSDEQFAWRKDNAIHIYLYAVMARGPFPFNAQRQSSARLKKSFCFADALNMAVSILTTPPPA